MPIYRPLFQDEEAAIVRFAKAEGPLWKQKLAQVYWYNARIWSGGEPGDGAVLHGLRNDPRWNTAGLDRYKLPKKQKP
jgi:hypothetical protein